MPKATLLAAKMQPMPKYRVKTQVRMDAVKQILERSLREVLAADAK